MGWGGERFAERHWGWKLAAGRGPFASVSASTGREGLRWPPELLDVRLRTSAARWDLGTISQINDEEGDAALAFRNLKPAGDCETSREMIPAGFTGHAAGIPEVSQRLGKCSANYRIKYQSR